MGRTIGAAVGAVLVVLFLASVAMERGRTAASIAASSARVSTDAQNRTVNKTMPSVETAQPARRAH